MGKLKYSFPIIFIIVGVVLSALLIENLGFLTDSVDGTLSDIYFYMLFALASLSFIAGFILEHSKNKTGIDYVLFAFMAIFYLTGSLAIWVYQDIPIINRAGIEVTAVVDPMEKLRYFLAFTLFIASVYSILFMFTKNIITARRMVWAYVVAIIVNYAGIIYSLATEMEVYKNLFSSEPAFILKSFYWNSNMFAGALLMGIASSMIINIYRKNVFSYISMLLFYIELLFVCSVISVVVASVVIVAYLVFEIIMSFKKHFVRSMVFTTIFIAAFTAIVCIIAAALDDKMGGFSFFIQRVYKEIFRTDFSTFSGRTEIWNGCIQLLFDHPQHLMLGYGVGISKTVIQVWGSDASLEPSIASAHNGIIQIFVNFGIIGLIIYSCFILYFFYVVIRLFGKYRRLSVIFFLVGVIFLGYAFGESVLFFNANAQGILMGFLFYLPILMKYKNLKHKDSINAVKGANISTRTLEGSLLSKTISMVIISLIVAIVPVLFMNSLPSYPLERDGIITILICLGVMLLFVPTLVSLWHKDTTLRSFKIRAFINLGVILLIFGFGTFIHFMVFARNLSGTFKIYFPCLLGGILLVEVVYYSIIKKPSFKEFFSTFVAIFKTCAVGIVVSLTISIVVMFLLRDTFEQGLLKYLIIMVFTLVIYYATCTLCAFSDMKEIMNYFENRWMNSLYLALLKDEMAGI